MEKENISIDLTIGQKKFDTSKMSDWTEEVWRAWIGEPEGYKGFTFDLLDDEALHFKVALIYYNEANNHMYVVFDIHNKSGQDISLEAGKWQVDETAFDAPNMLPVHLAAGEVKSGIEGDVPYMFMQNTLYLEFKVYEALTKRPVRELAFDVKVYL